jgi:hypothetical protein
MSNAYAGQEKDPALRIATNQLEEQRRSNQFLAEIKNNGLANTGGLFLLPGT